MLADLDAIHLRHHHIEHERVGQLAADKVQRLLAISRAKTEKTRVSETGSDEMGNCVVVLGYHKFFQQHSVESISMPPERMSTLPHLPPITAPTAAGGGES